MLSLSALVHQPRFYFSSSVSQDIPPASHFDHRTGFVWPQCKWFDHWEWKTWFTREGCPPFSVNGNIIWSFGYAVTHWHGATNSLDAWTVGVHVCSAMKCGGFFSWRKKKKKNLEIFPYVCRQSLRTLMIILSTINSASSSEINLLWN